MAYAPRMTSMLPPGPAASSLRQPNSAISQQQSSALAARIASKKAELENLIQFRDMSNMLAGQMEALQVKIETLKDGTEAVACVLANWDNVLRAITMASTVVPATTKVMTTTETTAHQKDWLRPDLPLPATLVRIPTRPQNIEP
ncbi:DASH complex subunit Dad2-domain-containing protein [Aspergillus crustosus]